jgi:hypothetical protein
MRRYPFDPFEFDPPDSEQIWTSFYRLGINTPNPVRILKHAVQRFVSPFQNL